MDESVVQSMIEYGDHVVTTTIRGDRLTTGPGLPVPDPPHHTAQEPEHPQLHLCQTWM